MQMLYIYTYAHAYIHTYYIHTYIQPTYIVYACLHIYIHTYIHKLQILMSGLVGIVEVVGVQ